MSLLIYFIVLFFLGLYLSLSIPVPNSISKHVYLSLYSIRIASLQGNHGYFLLCSCKQKQKQDKMKQEHITVIFHSITHFNPFNHLSYITQHPFWF